MFDVLLHHGRARSLIRPLTDLQCPVSATGQEAQLTYFFDEDKEAADKISIDLTEGGIPTHIKNQAVIGSKEGC